MKLKQREVAERLNVDVATYSLWERGRYPIPDVRAYQFCKEYNLSERWLRTGVGEMFERSVLPKQTLELFWNMIIAMFRQLPPRVQETLIAAMQDCSKRSC
jgi:transcriptional regulator with XRE-family HTH domain